MHRGVCYCCCCALKHPSTEGIGEGKAILLIFQFNKSIIQRGINMNQWIYNEPAQGEHKDQFLNPWLAQANIRACFAKGDFY